MKNGKFNTRREILRACSILIGGSISGCSQQEDKPTSSEPPEVVTEPPTDTPPMSPTQTMSPTPTDYPNRNLSLKSGSIWPRSRFDKQNSNYNPYATAPQDDLSITTTFEPGYIQGTLMRYAGPIAVGEFIATTTGAGNLAAFGKEEDRWETLWNIGNGAHYPVGFEYYDGYIIIGGDINENGSNKFWVADASTGEWVWSFDSGFHYLPHVMAKAVLVDHDVDPRFSWILRQ